MELKEGMYLRHSGLEGEYPIIQKIIKLETPGRCGGKYKVYTDKCGDWFIDSDYIEIDKSKASNNIIDLIEEGDYVNGHQVYEVDRECCRITLNGGSYGDEFRLTYLRPALGENMGIKSIVTKEQFESMSYKVVNNETNN